VERGFDHESCQRHIIQALPLLTTARDPAAAVLRIPPPLLCAVRPAMADLVRGVADELVPSAAFLPTPGQEAPTREMSLRLEARLRHFGHENPGDLASAMERLRGLGEEPPIDTAAERELLAVLLFSGTLTGRLSAAEVARKAGLVLEREPAVSGGVSTALPLVVMAMLAAESVHDVASWLSTWQQARGQSTTGVDRVLLSAERAFVLVSLGRPTLAREYVERALASADAFWCEASMLILCTIALELRDAALSERILAKARRRQSVGLALTASLQILQASVDAQRGLRARALEWLLACGRQLEVSGWRNSSLFPWRPIAVWLYQRLGESESALRLVDEELAWTAAWGAPAAHGRALRLKGWLLGADGIPLLREAVGVLRSSSFELELAWTLVLLGRRLGRGAEAEAMLREASTIAAACGAPWPAERTEYGLGKASAPKTAILTRSERRVIALVNWGLTNQEIANELGVSSRAVEKHLTNSYRKLGISGRTELADSFPA
jgi:DNA-binding CsgD family transcriptional regulator